MGDQRHPVQRKETDQKKADDSAKTNADNQPNSAVGAGANADQLTILYRMITSDWRNVCGA